MPPSPILAATWSWPSREPTFRGIALMTKNLRHCRRCRSVVRHGLSSVLVCARFSVKRGYEPIPTATQKENRPRFTEVGQVNLTESRV